MNATKQVPPAPRLDTSGLPQAAVGLSYPDRRLGIGHRARSDACGLTGRLIEQASPRLSNCHHLCNAAILL